MKIKFDAELKFDVTEQSFLASRDLALGGKVQKYIDSECLQLMEPYTPFKTGRLMRSGTTLTRLGSGQIQYKPVAPSSHSGKSYAARLYYNPNLRFNRDVHPLAGAYWFDRMVNINKKNILKGACAIAGAKPSS